MMAAFLDPDMRKEQLFTASVRFSRFSGILRLPHVSEVFRIIRISRLAGFSVIYRFSMISWISRQCVIFSFWIHWRRSALLACTIVALLCFTASLTADTIRLKNGTTIIGRIVAQTGTSVTIRTDSGQQTIPKSGIANITYGPVDEEEMRRARRERQQEAERIRKEQLLRQRMLARRTDLQHFPGNVEDAIGEIRSIRKADVLYERNQSLWRSAIIPGWGHFYLDEYEKSLALLGLTAFSYSFFTSNYIEFKKAEEAYNSAIIPPLFTALYGADGLPLTYYYFNVLEDRARNREANLNLISWVAVLLWSYSIADVYYNHDQNFELSLKISEPEEASMVSRSSQSGAKDYNAGEIEFGISFEF